MCGTAQAMILYYRYGIFDIVKVKVLYLRCRHTLHMIDSFRLYIVLYIMLKIIGAVVVKILW
jgi:hypothetical protein